MTFFAGSLATGCASEGFHETVAVERLAGKSMEEVIRREGEPDKRTETQLVYKYETSEKITPNWAYILLYGLAGGGAGPGPDLTYIDRDYYCLFLEFENGVLVRHTKKTREPGESC